LDYVARTPLQLGQVLKAARKKRHLTQHAMGAKVGLRQAQISAIETRGADITVDTLYRLVSALGMELVLRDMASRDTPSTEW